MELQSGSLAVVGHCGSTVQRGLRSKALPLEVELVSGASLTGSTLRSQSKNAWWINIVL